MDFASLPVEYQVVLDRIEHQNALKITPLQSLGGGRTGALLYLVNLTHSDEKSLEHYILKLDRTRRSGRLDEVQRHKLAQQQAPPEFVHAHMPQLKLEHQHEGVVALFYTIAGQSLHNYCSLADFSSQNQLELIFRTANTVLLSGWNSQPCFKQAVHPQSLLKDWLGYRLTEQGHISRFLENHLQLQPETGGFLIEGQVFPNPFTYGRQAPRWGNHRLMDAVCGFQHGDLNIANLLVKFRPDDKELEGFYLIDFALYKPDMPLFYDLRYLEMSYLLRELGRAPLHKWIDLVLHYSFEDVPDPRNVPVELAGPCAVINSGRLAFQHWVQTTHPSLADDLWGQFWLASVAAGLNYCNKADLSVQERLTGLVYACAHLKRYCAQFGIPTPADVSLLYDSSHQGQGSLPKNQDISISVAPAKTLPAQLTPFIGRKDELARLTQLLIAGDNRLITLTGPGGTGKTRLALRAAEEVQSYFEHNIIFVPLADIRDPDLLITIIAQQIGVREGGSQSLLEITKSYLKDRQLLLILDNFEQLVDSALLVTELLAGAPRVKVLVTSRILLNLRGEREFFVPPLSLPPLDETASLQNLTRFEGIRLFVARAEAASAQFRLTGENAQEVLEICRRLDGLPLAIELAAARIRLLPPRAILSRLNNRLAVLTGGPRDLPARQQTLRSTIDWSYDLLEEDHKTLFIRLGVFVGGFSLEAVQAVCDPEGNLDTLAGLEALLYSSLLQRVDSQAGQVRFRMLETIREYALDQLESSGEVELIRQQHATYYSEILRVLTEENTLFSAEIGRWLDWIAEEYENIRSVVLWSQRSREQFMPGIFCTMGLFWYWYRRGHLTEGREWLTWALSTPVGRQTPPLQGMLYGMSGALAMHQSDFNTARILTQKSLDLALLLENSLFVGIGLTVQGMILLNRGEDASAKPVLEQAREIFEEIHIDWWLADNLLTLSTALLGLGDWDEALDIVNQAEVASRRVGDDWLAAYVLNGYGEVARIQGQYAQAGEYYKQGERILREQGDQAGELPRIIHSLGYVAQRQGDLEAAQIYFQESLSIFRKIGNRRGIAECLVGIAGLYAAHGQGRQAVILLGAAVQLMKTLDAAWWPTDRMEYERNLSAARALLDDAEFEAFWKQGQGMSLEVALEHAAHD